MFLGMTHAEPLILDPERAMKMALEPRGVAAELARICGISASAVSQWKRCPAERVLLVERISGGRVTRHQLRPDLYPEHDSPSATEAA
jgi:DNA-binding transcriptional regulator YdaS (Cro superfamily)